MKLTKDTAIHLIVNWKSSHDFVINSIAAHSMILKNGNDFVWYGKMVKTTPQVKILNQHYKKIENQIKSGIPTYLHLYSPDYKDQNIWHVGKIEGIQIEPPTESELIPVHYGRVPYGVSYWFKISDFREFNRGVMISNLYNVNDKRQLDLVSEMHYPFLVHHRPGLDDLFDYSITHRRKWFDFQKLYSDLLRHQTRVGFVFVIMPFNEQFNDIYKLGISKAVANLKLLKLKVERADDTILQKAIIKKIREKIKDADLIIADVTGNNPNVLYELGYAHALEKSTIILTNDRNTIPFDLNEKANIEYNPGDTTKLKNQLIKHIKSHFEQK
jgi:hypothetical protein